MEILFLLVGGLTAYFNYRSAKADGLLRPKAEQQPKEPYVQKPLEPGAGRLRRVAHWLGLDES